ncbi:MAG: hypothetical protein ACYTBS_09805 [Planctomycetota bacterium]|jgi:hypothetical protein
MGRKAKTLTDKQMAEVETLGAVLPVDQIAAYLGVGKTTFYAMMDRDPEISERYKRGKARAIHDVGKGLLQKALSGDTTSAIFYLKTQAGWRERDSRDQGVNGQVTYTVVTGVPRPEDS